VEKFIETKGYDIREYLASFYLPDPDDKMRKAKADYWDVWSALFASNFYSIQAEWCAENSLEYMVHMNHEDKMMQLVRSGGHFFRNMRDVQIPGVDAIWNQIWMDKIADFPKLASSAAHLNGRPRAMSESFAAYRIRPNVHQGKWVIDHQFARGINLFEIMFFGSSAEGGGRPRGWMASDSFPSLMEYTNRVSWLLCQGIPTAKIALYMPTRSLWMGDKEANENTWRIARQLLEQQRDFDFVDGFSISGNLKLVNGHLVNHSGQAYESVIIPGTSIITQAVLESLEKFSSSGGKVLVMGRKPEWVFDSVFMEAEVFSMPEWALWEPSGEFTPKILNALPDKDIILQPGPPSVKYIHRRIKNADLYFLFNESQESVSVRARLEGSGSLFLLEAYTGEMLELKEFKPMDNATELDLSLGPHESRIYLITAAF
jgi:hypothetical protein